MNSKRSKQFATTGCQTVEDLIEHIRQLPGTGLSQFDIEDISMRTSTGRTLSLESSLKHLLDDEDFENSQDEPLRLKSTKHIEIVEVDSCGRPVGELKKIDLSSNQALVQLMSSMPTFILAPFDDQQTLIAEFSAIEDGKRYVWRSMHEAMENEVTLCIVSFLQSRGQQKISVYNGEISTFQHRVLQEWDGIVYSGEESKLYLAEAKHNMRIEDLDDMQQIVFNHLLYSKRSTIQRFNLSHVVQFSLLKLEKQPWNEASLSAYHLEVVILSRINHRQHLLYFRTFKMQIQRKPSSINFALSQAVKEAISVRGNAAEALIRCLESEGVTYVFGVPGEETLDLIESLRQSSARGGIRFVLTRHEQAAGFMACAVARLTDRTGVCLSTLGPGATNCSTAIAHAFLAGIPLLILTGQKPVRHSKQGQFQVIDVVDHFHSITKYSRSVVEPSLVPSLVRKCFRISRLEKPGPVHLELPEDIASMSVGEGRFVFPRHELRRPGPDQVALNRASELIASAKSPLVCVCSAAGRRLSPVILDKFLKSTGLFAVCTQMGKGVVDGTSAQFVGVTALSENDLVHVAIEAADLIIHLGHDTTEKPPFFMQQNSPPVVIHFHFRPATIDEVYFPHLEVVGDLNAAIDQLTDSLSKQPHWDLTPFQKVRAAVIEHIIESPYSKSNAYPMNIQKVVRDARAVLAKDSVICLDTGMFKIWFARQFQSSEPTSVLMDNALATMGAGLPYAIGAKLVVPNKQVLAVCGDGGFMMNSQEMETAVRLGLHLVVLVLNDGQYGMIRWKQENEGLADFGMTYTNPDFVAYARSYGARGYRVNTADEFKQILESCLHAGTGVHLIDVPINYQSSSQALKSDLAVHVNSLRRSLHTGTRTPMSSEAEWVSLTPKERVRAVKDEFSSPSVKEIPVRENWAFNLGGKSCLSSQHLSVFNKFDGSKIADVCIAGPEMVKEAITQAVASQPLMESLSGYQRKRILKHCVSRFRERKEELATVLCLEAGKPIRDARAEVERMIETFELASEECTRLHGDFQSLDYSERGANTQQVTRRVPVGPIAMISPFNFPLNLVAHKVAPAIAVGCAFVLKPASLTPLGALIIGEILSECEDLPKGCFSVIPSTRSAADILVTSEHLKMLSFTGSPLIGWDLKARAGKKKVVLELGGNAACIVDTIPKNSADFSNFIERIVSGGFHQAGQSCIHLQRLLIRRDLFKQVVNGVISKVRELTTGNPMCEDTFVGPLISETECLRVEGWVNAAVEAGAHRLIGGDRSGSIYPPTVLENIPLDSKVWADEVFGPVLCVAPYDDYNSAIDLVNNSRFGIHAGVFTDDINKIMYAWKRLQVGGVIVNDVPSIRIDSMPYGGVKDSGVGREGVRYAMEEMTEIRSLVFRGIDQ